MSSERSVGVHMVGQLVGEEPAVWPQRSRARPRLTAKSSHTVSERARRTGRCGCLGHRCTTCPRPGPATIVPDMLGDQTDGGGKWQTQEAARRGQAASAWRVTQVNNPDHDQAGTTRLWREGGGTGRAATQVQLQLESYYCVF